MRKKGSPALVVLGILAVLCIAVILADGGWERLTARVSAWFQKDAWPEEPAPKNPQEHYPSIDAHFDPERQREIFARLDAANDEEALVDEYGSLVVRMRHEAGYGVQAGERYAILQKCPDGKLLIDYGEGEEGRNYLVGNRVYRPKRSGTCYAWEYMTSHYNEWQWNAYRFPLACLDVLLGVEKGCYLVRADETHMLEFYTGKTGDVIQSVRKYFREDNGDWVLFGEVTYDTAPAQEIPQSVLDAMEEDFGSGEREETPYWPEYGYYQNPVECYQPLTDYQKERWQEVQEWIQKVNNPERVLDAGRAMQIIVMDPAWGGESCYRMQKNPFGQGYLSYVSETRENSGDGTYTVGNYSYEMRQGKVVDIDFSKYSAEEYEMLRNLWYPLTGEETLLGWQEWTGDRYLLLRDESSTQMLECRFERDSWKLTQVRVYRQDWGEAQMNLQWECADVPPVSVPESAAEAIMENNGR